MKHAFRFAPVVVFAAFMFAACAESEETPATAPTNTTPADAGSIVVKEASAPTDSATTAKVCVNGCKTDSECQSSCPAATELYCCDVQSGVCFKHNQTSCPSQDTDSGTQNPTY